MIFRFIPPNAVKAAVLARFFHAGGEIRHKGLRIVHRHIIPTQIRRNLYQAVPVHTHNRYESVAPAAASRSATSARSRLCRRWLKAKPPWSSMQNASIIRPPPCVLFPLYTVRPTPRNHHWQSPAPFGMIAVEYDGGSKPPPYEIHKGREKWSNLLVIKF